MQIIMLPLLSAGLLHGATHQNQQDQVISDKRNANFILVMWKLIIFIKIYFKFTNSRFYRGYCLAILKLQLLELVALDLFKFQSCWRFKPYCNSIFRAH